MFICNWYLERLGVSHFSASASITEYWQGMMSDLIDLMDMIRLRTYWCPHHYELRNHRGVAWCWYFWQLISREVEYIILHYKCFHHWVLARNDVSFDWFPDLDPSKNILHRNPGTPNLFCPCMTHICIIWYERILPSLPHIPKLLNMHTLI